MASFWKVNYVPQSAWGTTPAGEAAAGGWGRVEWDDHQRGALLLARGVSQDWARVHATHGAQVGRALRASQVGE